MTSSLSIQLKTCSTAVSPFPQGQLFPSRQSPKKVSPYDAHWYYKFLPYKRRNFTKVHRHHLCAISKIGRVREDRELKQSSLPINNARNKTAKGHLSSSSFTYLVLLNIKRCTDIHELYQSINSMGYLTFNIHIFVYQPTYQDCIFLKFQ